MYLQSFLKPGKKKIQWCQMLPIGWMNFLKYSMFFLMSFGPLRISYSAWLPKTWCSRQNPRFLYNSRQNLNVKTCVLTNFPNSSFTPSSVTEGIQHVPNIHFPMIILDLKKWVLNHFNTIMNISIVIITCKTWCSN